MKKVTIFLMALMAFVSAGAQDDCGGGEIHCGKHHGEKPVVVDVKTTLGDFKLLLYNDTPAHRDNFVKLVNEHFYDGITFHRVIKDFMVQAGDPNSKNDSTDVPLGATDTDYTLPPEIHYPRHFHKYGALAAARTNNPQKRSSGSQFYIVTGQKWPAEQVEPRALRALRQARFDEIALGRYDELMNLRKQQGDDAFRAELDKIGNQVEAEVTTVPTEILETYTTQGGTPHLDNDYTVFGEVFSGMDVIEKIQNVETGRDDVPVQPVRILGMSIEK